MSRSGVKDYPETCRRLWFFCFQQHQLLMNGSASAGFSKDFWG
jgi:hypothetical protein